MGWTSPPSFGVGLFGAEAAARAVEWARAAEAAGIDSVWLVEDYFQHSAVALAGAAAAATSRATLGLGVVNPFTRHPALVAMEAATLAALAPGRVVLGLGTGVRRWIETQMRLPFEAPLGALREAVDVIQRLLRGERVTLKSSAFGLDDVALAYPPAAPAPPIVLGVKGPRALALAGEVADGVLCSVMSSPAHVTRVRETTGAARRGRGRPGPFPVLAYTPIAVSADGREARRWVRPLIARYCAHLHGQSIMRDAAVPEPVGAALRAAIGRGDDGADVVTDELVDTFAIAGTPDACRRAIDRWIRAGLTAPVAVTLPGTDVREQLRLMGDELVPYWAARASRES
jgi:5,10-methylenetetrahydromethanopterin reductase